MTGPDAHVSPDWYGAPDMVPTWNYVAVHLHGTLERRPDTELPDLLARQSHDFERQLAPKPEWTMDKLSDDALTRLLRMIVPFRLTITEIQSTWKLGQNRSAEQRLGAADGIAEAGIGSETDALACLSERTRDLLDQAPSHYDAYRILRDNFGEMESVARLSDATRDATLIVDNTPAYVRQLSVVFKPHQSARSCDTSHYPRHVVVLSKTKLQAR